MSRLGRVVRRYLLGRAVERRRMPPPYVQVHRPVAPGAGRFGLWGPVPYYRTRTRRGSDVSVGGCGCCLPIPLLAAVGTAGGLRALWRRRAR
jgi:hypothetical protein